jgi:hypothetical protein
MFPPIFRHQNDQELSHENIFENLAFTPSSNHDTQIDASSETASKGRPRTWKVVDARTSNHWDFAAFIAFMKSNTKVV